MSVVIAPKNRSVIIPQREGSLRKYLEQTGKLPPVTLSIFPLQAGPANVNDEIFIDKFISYGFNSSILVPVDSFTCEFFYEAISGYRKPRDGDILVLRSNGTPIFTGVIDQPEIETDATMGTKMTVTGRDLLGLWEDQDAVNLDASIIWSNRFTVSQVISALSKDTRIDPTKIILRNAPRSSYLFATQPGESKISAIQRFCESLDIYFWMNGDGRIIIGKPDMYATRQGRRGTLYLLKSNRSSNCLTMRSVRNNTQIPNVMVPIWNGQETVQNRITKEQIIENGSEGPSRLRRLGHRVAKAVVVSTPEGSTPQDLSDINALTVANQNVALKKLTKAGASTLLQAYAKREMARANLKELNVQVQMYGHYNDLAEPFQVDQVYRIRYDIDDIDEDMYLYEIEYKLDEKSSQLTKLFFCRQTALVSDVRAL